MELVNGFVCKNCTDVGYAKKFIDPAHPKDGPNGKDAPDRKTAEKADQDRGPAVTLSGVLQGLQATPSERADRPAPLQPGTRLDISV